MSQTPSPTRRTILLAAPPSLLRSSLLAYLRILPGVEVVVGEERPGSIPELLGQLNPDILILDMSPIGLGGSFDIHTVYSLRPGLNIIVLVEDLNQKNQALALGARHAFLKGLLDDCLKQAVLGPTARPEITG